MTDPEGLSGRRTRGRGQSWSAWRVVWWFGFVSLAADMVYEGARSVYGPLLASLGATAIVVGLVTGAGEAMALVLRLVFGPLADRTGRYWALTMLGYGLTAVCVPLLAVTPFVGGAGLALAAVLILLERSGKAVRSPSKSALLAHVASAVGRGRGFGVHKALDQVGALAGPLARRGGHRRRPGRHLARHGCPRRPGGGRHGAARRHPLPGARPLRLRRWSPTGKSSVQPVPSAPSGRVREARPGRGRAACVAGSPTPSGRGCPGRSSAMRSLPA